MPAHKGTPTKKPASKSQHTAGKSGAAATSHPATPKKKPQTQASPPATPPATTSGQGG